MKQRAAARQTDLQDLLVSILRPDAQGLRTRINASFHEWTDCNKRAGVTLNVTLRQERRDAEACRTGDGDRCEGTGLLGCLLAPAAAIQVSRDGGPSV